MIQASGKKTEHPSDQVLCAFGNGRLAPDDASRVEKHVESCDVCAETLLTLDEEDTFAGLLMELSEDVKQALAQRAPFAEETTSCSALDPNSKSDAGHSIELALRDHPKYELVELIGRGGMGTAYRARHKVMKRDVALKSIESSSVDEQSRQRFIREVLVAGQLSYPNVVRAFDAEQIGDSYFLVMEFVSGQTIGQQVTSQGPLSYQTAFQYVMQAARGLQYAHEKGLVHRDIKPQNLILESISDKANSEERSLKILDFGLVNLGVSQPKQTNISESDLTSAGTVMGTPDYIAPEQIADASSADIRSDIYSLGATLHFMLTGRPPFEGTSRQKLESHATKAIELPPDVAKDLPEAAKSIFRSMTAPDPAFRYQEPRELELEVAELLHDPASSKMTRKLTNYLGAISMATMLIFLCWMGWNTPHQSNSESSQTLGTTQRIVSPTKIRAQGITTPPQLLDRASTLENTKLVVAPVVEKRSPKTDPAPKDLVLSLPDPDEYVYFSEELRKLCSNQSVDITKHLPVLLNPTKDKRFVWTQLRLDGLGEAYLSKSASKTTDINAPIRLVVRQRKPKTINIRLMLPNHNGDAMEQISLKLARNKFKSANQLESKRSFFEVMESHYEFLASQKIPGTPWFRQRALYAEQQKLKSRAAPATLQLDHSAARERSRTGFNNPSRTYEILSGGAAIADNLRLGDLIGQAKTISMGTATVPISSIRGVRVPAFNWAPLIKGLEPEYDALAPMIPEDQHVFFFDSFPALLATLDRAQRDGGALFQLMQLQAEQSGVLPRYQTQLGISLNELARTLGGELVESLAITGGDPFFDTGTDVALIFQPKNAVALQQLLKAQIGLTSGRFENAKRTTGAISGITYEHFFTPDRKLHSYLCQIGDAIVVANSEVQITNIQSAISGKTKSITNAPEYKFFRNRYPLANEKEGGLLIISDQAIRRWSGPEWRIGASRRLYARSALSAIQAEYLHSGKDPTKVAANPSSIRNRFQSLTGNVRWHNGAISGDKCGTLDSLKPISEQRIRNVTNSEKASYERWRASYERLWSNRFDPIAVSFAFEGDDLSFDTTVMPLARGNDYALASSFTRNGSVNPEGMDQHDDSILHVGVSLHKSLLQMVLPPRSSQLPEQLNVDPLAWYGSTASIYVDDDDYWKEKGPSNFTDWFGEEAPIALTLEVADPKTMPMFFLALRTFFENGILGDTAWTTVQHAGQKYFRFTTGNGTLFIAHVNNTVTFSPSRSLIERAINRHNQNQKDKGANNEPDDQEEEFAAILRSEGFAVQDKSQEEAAINNVTFRLNGDYMKAIHKVLNSGSDRYLKHTTWNNIPILNEWKKLYPGQDPVAVHALLWRRQLAAFDNSSYQWDPDRGTMYSKNFGSPGTDIEDDALVPDVFRDIESAEFGFRFENNGIRVRGQIDRKD